MAMQNHPHSTASFALDPAYSMSATMRQLHSMVAHPSGQEANDPNPHSPLRPARSMRRPQQASEVSKVLQLFCVQHFSGSRPSRTATAAAPDSSPVGIQSTFCFRSLFASGHAPVRATSSLLRDRTEDIKRAIRPHRAAGAAQLARMVARRSRNRHARSAQLMSQLSHPGTPDSEDRDEFFDVLSPSTLHLKVHATAYTAIIRPTPTTYRCLVSVLSATRVACLGALSARSPKISNRPLSIRSSRTLTTAGRKGQAARIMRGTTAEEESSRRRSEKKISETSQQVRKPLTAMSTDRTRALSSRSTPFCARSEAEWPFLAHDRFNSVALALSMLDQSSLGASRFEFEQLKQIIETSLRAPSTTTSNPSQQLSRCTTTSRRRSMRRSPA